MLVASRKRLTKLGLRPRWTGSQAQAIRLEPGKAPPPPDLSTVAAVAVLERWRLTLRACAGGWDWAKRYRRSVADAISVVEADLRGSTYSPAGYARWAARELTCAHSPDGPLSSVTLWAIEVLREAVRWVPSGDAPRAA